MTEKLASLIEKRGPIRTIGVVGMGIPTALLFTNVPPGFTHDLDAVLAGAVVVFAGHKKYGSLVPAELKALQGFPHPAIVDGRNVSPT